MRTGASGRESDHLGSPAGRRHRGQPSEGAGPTADIAGGADVAGRDPGPPRIGPIRGGPPVRHRTRRSPCAGRHARSPAAPSIL